MNIVIAGAGETGKTLCRDLSGNLNIILIDRNKHLIEEALNEYDIEAIVGNAGDVEIQREAGVDKADVFVATSESDELNIIACLVAKSLGARNTIARIRDPEYMASAAYIKDSLGITEIINPNMEAANKIKEIVRFGEIDNIEYFMNDQLNLVALKVDREADLIGKKLQDIDWKNKRILICIIERGEELIIPHGQRQILEGDEIYITGDKVSLASFYREMKIDSQPVESAFIIGGARTAYYLMNRLEEARVQTKLIEIDYSKAEQFAIDFPSAIVIHGDGTDQDLLLEENIDRYDTVISLTGVDEENLMASLFARHLGISKTITKVRNNKLLKLLHNTEIGTTINLKRLTVDRISRFIRSLSPNGHSEIKTLYTIADEKALALEFEVKEGNGWCKGPIKDLEIKDSVLLAGILRKGRVLIPNGDMQVMVNDRLLLITSQTDYDGLEELLNNE